MKKILLILCLALPLLALAQQKRALTIEQAISITLKNNYGIIIQNKYQKINDVNNTWGKVGVLPSINISANTDNNWNYNETENFRNQNSSGTISLNWVLFRGFGAFIDKTKLEEMEKLSEGNLAVVVENTISNVILTYYRVLLQKENITMAEKLMALSRDRYNNEKMRVDIGSSVTYNLLQAKNSYLEDKSNYLSAASNYNNAVRQLNFLMAEPLENNYNFLHKFTADTSSFDKAMLFKQMLSNNNTLKNQYINLELAKLDVRSARSSFFPTLTGNASGGYSDSETKYDTNTFMNSSVSGYNASISLGLSFSLFDGGKKRQALKVAKLQKAITDVETEEKIAELKNQLAQEYELYQVRKEMLTLADENLEAAELNLKISQQKFDSGAINSFNFRDVQQLYLSVSLKQHNAIYDVIESYHSLLRLTGGLIDEYK
jgi:outer membrane protein